MLEPIRAVFNLITYEPLDEVTRDYVQHWLDDHYPQATWEVVIVNQGRSHDELVIVPHFSNAQDETFYLIKWS